ncbi:hypothetical protein H072_10108 [Dactylellina haptotyla CBS 200.50]|uniref:Uncharacterized protein n=1 Tax=Dactylellina haptotyla (strain CBS 200.50) TaxID=1284197 RepID=S8A5L1_DACHA|nr:hypothetical protein H072_10108 [Dactylellina haptotyla CBS 200.50]
MSADSSINNDPFALPSLILTKLSVPATHYVSEPSDAIVINLTLNPKVVITCSTISGHELGYFGWKSGAVDIGFENDSEVVISYSTTPTIWSHGQRVPETKEFLSERGWFHTFANVVTRGSSDGSGIMKLSVKSLLDHHERGSQDIDTATITPPEMREEDYDDDRGESLSGLSSPSRTPKPLGKDKKRVVKGRIGKIGKVKRASVDGTEAMKKLLTPLEKLKI